MKEKYCMFSQSEKKKKPLNITKEKQTYQYKE